MGEKVVLRFSGGPYDGREGALVSESGGLCSCDEDHEFRYGGSVYVYNKSLSRRKGKIEARFVEELVCPECGCVVDELPDGTKLGSWTEDVCLSCVVDGLTPEQAERLHAELAEDLVRRGYHRER